MRYADACERFIRRCEAKGRSDHTLTFYKNQFRYFLAWLTERGKATGTDWLDEELFFDYFAGLQKRVKKSEIQPETANASYRALRALCNWLHEPPQQRITINPMRLVEPPTVPPKEPRRTDLDDITRLIQSIESDNWVDHRDRLIITVLFWCGLRVGPLCRLKVGDIDTHGGTLRVGKDKSGAPHYVPLLPVVKQAFTAYIYSRPATAATELFVSSDGHYRPLDTGITPTGVRQMLERRSLAAGFDRGKNPHSLRHGIAMHLLNELGADLGFISKLLDHRDTKTTENFYARWKTAGLAKQYQRLVDGRKGEDSGV
jgi:integrase/recombinase XerD